MVRLLREIEFSGDGNGESFNPTMVRLLQHTQSLHGCNHSRFNPTMVRLLHERIKAKAEREGVSIPQWCDCCGRKDKVSGGNANGFNPTMVRLLRGLCYSLSPAV